MLPDNIFINLPIIIPVIEITDVNSEYLGTNIYRYICKVNGLNAKRIRVLFRKTVWQVEVRIVADWFAALLESAWKRLRDGRVIVIT
jgi:hypothetical protein